MRAGVSLSFDTSWLRCPALGGTPEAKDLFGLFDDTLNRLLAALQ